MNAPLAFLGIPSVDEIVGKIAKGIFKAIADAIIPDWLKDAGGKFFVWLVNVPNPANPSKMPNVAVLEKHTMWLAVALLGLTSVAAGVRYTIGAMTADENPIQAWFRTVYAAAGLVLYQWAFVNAIALVNVLTLQIFSWPVVNHGITALGKSVFVAGAFGPGVGTPILAVFSIIAFCVVIILIATKVAIFMVLTMLYVGGPLAIALSPIPEFAGVVRNWAQSVVAVLMVPLMWTLMFATAGVFVRDLPKATGLLAGSGVAGKIGAAFISALAAVMVLYLAMKVGTKGLSHVTSTLSGFLQNGSSGRSMTGFATGMAGGEARARIRGSVGSQAVAGAGRQTTKRAALAAVTAAAGGGAAAAGASRAGAGADTAARQARASADASASTRRDGTEAGPSKAAARPRRRQEGSSELARGASGAGHGQVPNGSAPQKGASGDAPKRARTDHVDANGRATSPPENGRTTSRRGGPTPTSPVGAPTRRPQVVDVPKTSTPPPASPAAPKRRIEDAGQKVTSQAKSQAKAVRGAKSGEPSPRAPRPVRPRHKGNTGQSKGRPR